jgi:hypothetical protein
MRLLLVLSVLCLAAALAATPTARAGVAPYEVNSSANAGDGTCDATCTLRDAIDDANASVGVPDEISFDTGRTITLTSALPDITDTVTINGRQGAACTGLNEAGGVQLDGGNQPINGLVLTGSTSNGSRICALNIIDFADGIQVQSDNNTIDGNRIGTTLNGEAAASNSGVGIVVNGGDNNTIGGPLNLAANPPTHNLISGNSLGGVALVGNAQNNTIAGNLIGTDKDGDTAVPNGTGLNGAGISVPASSTGTVIGGDTAVERNVISGNAPVGVDAQAGTIIGNYVGVDVDGSDGLANTTGMTIGGPVTVGGDTLGEVNVISGNTTQGLFVNAAATIKGNWIGPGVGAGPIPVELTTGSQPRGILLQGFSTGTASDTTIGGTAEGEGNVIAYHEDDGIEFDTILMGTPVPVDDVSILQNVIHDNGDGEGGDAGIDIDSGSTDTRIGNPLDGNVIRDNDGDGIFVDGSGTIFEGNIVGLDESGDAAAPNDRGIRIGSNAVSTRVGGTATGAGNTISGNTEEGVLLGDDSTSTTVQGNVIGLNADGDAARPNDVGIDLFDSDDAVIGGTAAGAANVISGNTDHGIFISGGSDDALIQGNVIGLSRTGVDLGNGAHGIALGTTTGADIGGTSAAASNILSGNGEAGLSIQSSVVNASVRGNRIGVAADGVTARPNDEAGVEVSTAASAPVTIGGTGAGEGNVIQSNGQDGVRVDVNTASAALLGNTFRANGVSVVDDLGIDLGMQAQPDDGVNGNDAGDVDTGPNGLQNFPVLTSAVSDGSSTTVTGTIDTTPGADVRVELFSGGSCDEAGHGQGEVLLGADELTAGSGATSFTATVAGTTAGRQITATATNLDDNTTSEFSACRLVDFRPPPPPPPPPPPASAAVVAPAASLTPAVLGVPAPKFPAKIRVLRNGVDDGVLDMLIEITARAATAGAELEIAYQSSGRTTRFDVPITGTQIKVRKTLPSSQPKDTGITTVTYDGNSIVDPDEVRLRAADGKSQLVRSSSTIRNGRLSVNGTVSDRARGVVRIRMSYARPDGSTGLLDFRAPIDDGTWKLDQTLPAEAAAGGQLSIQFTGYEAANLRGEQTAKQVP